MSLAGTGFEFPSKDGYNRVELVWEANENKLELRHEIVLRRSIKYQIRVHENKTPWDLLLEYVCTSHFNVLDHGKLALKMLTLVIHCQTHTQQLLK